MQEPGLTPPRADTSIPKPQADQAPHVSVESAPKRMTPQDVEQARVEKEAAFTQLMDEMEASVETQGDWFVKLGSKKPITEVRQITTVKFMGLGKTTRDQEQTIGYADDRALILKATINSEGTPSSEDFVVVTPDGIKVIPFYHGDIDNSQSGNARDYKANYDRLKDLTSGKKKPDASNKYQKPTGESWRGAAIVISRDVGNSIIGLENPNRFTTGTLSPEVFQSAVQESIQLTESPFKKHVEEAQQQTEFAKGAINAVRGLPPRE